MRVATEELVLGSTWRELRRGENWTPERVPRVGRWSSTWRKEERAVRPLGWALGMGAAEQEAPASRAQGREPRRLALERDGGRRERATGRGDRAQGHTARGSAGHGTEQGGARRARQGASAGELEQGPVRGRAVEQGPGRDASSEFRTRVLDFILELSGGWSWNTGEPGAALERSEQGTTG